MQVTINRDGQQMGPYTIEQINEYLAQGSLLPTDYAWHEGLPDWVPVTQISGVGPAASPPPFNPAQAPAVAPEGNAKKKKLMLIGGIAGGVALIAVLALVLLKASGGTDAQNINSNTEGSKPNAQSVRDTTAKQKGVTGTYERYEPIHTFRHTLLDDGTWEHYLNGKRNNTGNWSKVANEVHIEMSNSNTGASIYRINTDNSITFIAYMDDGIRKGIPTERQYTWTKGIIPNPTRKVTAEEKEVLGTYNNATTDSGIKFLDNGLFESYTNGKLDVLIKVPEPRWAIVDKEIHMLWADGIISVYRINPDGNIQGIARIKDFKRTAEKPGVIAVNVYVRQ